MSGKRRAPPTLTAEKHRLAFPVPFVSVTAVPRCLLKELCRFCGNHLKTRAGRLDAIGRMESELWPDIIPLVPGLGTAPVHHWKGKLVSADQTGGPQGELAGRSAKLKSLVDLNQLLIKAEMGFCHYAEQHNSA